MRRRLDPEAERERAALHAEMVALGRHGSWPALQTEVVREKARIERMIVHQALKPDGLDQRRIDFLRGVIRGMEWIAALPEGSERSLERYLTENGVPTEGVV